MTATLSPLGERAPAVALDLHEGITHTRTSGGCARWPKALRLASSTGRLVEGRCRATNLCSYCQKLYTVETVEALTLDALGGSAPTVWVVLTAREHLTRPELNEHLRVIRQTLKRRGWRVDWFVQVEFQRRGALHANLLVKGLHGAQCEAFRAELVSLWCARVDAEPVGQWAQAVGDALAVSRYCAKMLAHGMKQEQAPPIGWKGHRTSHTRGYFDRPMWKVRAEARASLAHKRALHRAELEGYEALEAEHVASVRVLRASQERWECVVVQVNAVTGELERLRPLSGKDFTAAMRSAVRHYARSRREVALADAGRAAAVALSLSWGLKTSDWFDRTPTNKRQQPLGTGVCRGQRGAVPLRL